jgi:hypothetical protein
MKTSLFFIVSMAVAGTSLAQTGQPGATTPSVTPSQTPAITPSQTPAITPSQTPSVVPQSPSAIPQTPNITSETPNINTPGAAPVIGGPAPAIVGNPAVGGLSACENLIGVQREQCLQTQSSGRPAGAGGSHAPGSTGTGAGTMGPQNTAPAGSVR